MAKAMLNFVEMDYTREVAAWIFENTHDEEKNASLTLNFKTSHKSRVLIDKWKTDLPIGMSSHICDITRSLLS